MAIAFVNKVNSNTVGNGNVTVATAAMNLTAGNFVAVAVCTNRANNTQGFSIADVAGNTFHLVSGGPYNPGTTWGLYIYYIYNALGSAVNVFTVTSNTGMFSGQIVVSATQFSGLPTSDPSTGVLANAETAAGQPINSGSLTLTGSEGVVYAPVIIDSTGGGLTPGTGFTAQLMDGTSTYDYFYDEYKIVSVSTAATGTVSGTTYPNDISAAMFQTSGGGATSGTNWLSMFSGALFFSPLFIL